MPRAACREGCATGSASHACDCPATVQKTAGSPTLLSLAPDGEVNPASHPRPAACPSAWPTKVAVAAADEPTLPDQIGPPSPMASPPADARLSIGLLPGLLQGPPHQPSIDRQRRIPE